MSKEQRLTIAVLFNALQTLAKDKTFHDKLQMAYEYDGEIEDDYIALINFKEDVIEFTKNNFNMER